MGKDRDAFAESKAVEHLEDSQSSKSMQIGDMNPDNKISLEHLVGLFEPSERASLLRSIHLFVPGEHDIAVRRIISKLHTSLLTPGGLDFNSVLNIMLRFDEEGRQRVCSKLGMSISRPFAGMDTAYTLAKLVDRLWGKASTVQAIGNASSIFPPVETDPSYEKANAAASIELDESEGESIGPKANEYYNKPSWTAREFDKTEHPTRWKVRHVLLWILIWGAIIAVVALSGGGGASNPWY
jgi:hypothetical protein